MIGNQIKLSSPAAARRKLHKMTSRCEHCGCAVKADVKICKHCQIINERMSDVKDSFTESDFCIKGLIDEWMIERRKILNEIDELCMRKQEELEEIDNKMKEIYPDDDFQLNDRKFSSSSDDIPIETTPKRKNNSKTFKSPKMSPKQRSRFTNVSIDFSSDEEEEDVYNGSSNFSINRTQPHTPLSPQRFSPQSRFLIQPHNKKLKCCDCRQEAEKMYVLNPCKHALCLSCFMAKNNVSLCPSCLERVTGQRQICNQ